MDPKKQVPAVQTSPTPATSKLPEGISAAATAVSSKEVNPSSASTSLESNLPSSKELAKTSECLNSDKSQEIGLDKLSFSESASDTSDGKKGASTALDKGPQFDKPGETYHSKEITLDVKGSSKSNDKSDKDTVPKKSGDKPGAVREEPQTSLPSDVSQSVTETKETIREEIKKDIDKPETTQKISSYIIETESNPLEPTFTMNGNSKDIQNGEIGVLGSKSTGSDKTVIEKISSSIPSHGISETTVVLGASIQSAEIKTGKENLDEFNTSTDLPKLESSSKSRVNGDGLAMNGLGVESKPKARVTKVIDVVLPPQGPNVAYITEIRMEPEEVVPSSTSKDINVDISSQKISQPLSKADETVRPDKTGALDAKSQVDKQETSELPLAQTKNGIDEKKQTTAQVAPVPAPRSEDSKTLDNLKDQTKEIKKNDVNKISVSVTKDEDKEKSTDANDKDKAQKTEKVEAKVTDAKISEKIPSSDAMKKDSSDSPSKTVIEPTPKDKSPERYTESPTITISDETKTQQKEEVKTVIKQEEIKDSRTKEDILPTIQKPSEKILDKAEEPPGNIASDKPPPNLKETSEKETKFKDSKLDDKSDKNIPSKDEPKKISDIDSSKKDASVTDASAKDKSEPASSTVSTKTAEITPAPCDSAAKSIAETVSKSDKTKPSSDSNLSSSSNKVTFNDQIEMVSPAESLKDKMSTKLEEIKEVPTPKEEAKVDATKFKDIKSETQATPSVLKESTQNLGTITPDTIIKAQKEDTKLEVTDHQKQVPQLVDKKSKLDDVTNISPVGTDVKSKDEKVETVNIAKDKEISTILDVDKDKSKTKVIEDQKTDANKIEGDKETIIPSSKVEVKEESKKQDETKDKISSIQEGKIANGDIIQKETLESKDIHLPRSTKVHEGLSKLKGEELPTCRIATETKDVGVGREVIQSVRVAAAEGAEEEVDGQQATAEVEVTEETQEAEAEPSSSDDHAQSIASKHSATVSAKEEASKPASAISSKKVVISDSSSSVSNVPVPPAVYQPPERKKSSTSEADRSKSGSSADAVEEKETSKEEETKSDVLESKEEEEKLPEDTKKEEDEKEEVDEKDEKEVTEKETEAVDEKDTEEKEQTEEKDLSDQKESGSEVEKDVAEQEKEEEAKEEEETTAVESKEDSQDVADDSKDAQPEETKEKEISEEQKDDEKKEESKSESDQADGTSEIDKEVEKEETKEIDEEQDKQTEAVEETKVESEESKEDIEKEEPEESKGDAEKGEPEESKEDAEKGEPEESKEDAEKGEPEESKDEEKEESKESEKDEVAADVKLEESEESKEVSKETNDVEESEKKADEPTTAETEEGESKPSEEETAGEEEVKTEDQEEKSEPEKAAEEELKEVAEEPPTAEDTLAPETEKDTEEKEGEEKEPEEKGDEQEEEKKEPSEKRKDSLRSPTKRKSKSPPKHLSRKGGSPAPPQQSPPKPVKTPPSPKKPLTQKSSSSPKKKNGLLSPVKTPKTPGVDARKLPPIKAPVGLAPNPNLKNIKSKIGSFDNIKYKPGGGDKKMTITKKLEWRATSKIGSLDRPDKKRDRSKGSGKDDDKGDEDEQAKSAPTSPTPPMDIDGADEEIAPSAADDGKEEDNAATDDAPQEEEADDPAATAQESSSTGSPAIATES